MRIGVQVSVDFAAPKKTAIKIAVFFIRGWYRNHNK